jgi:hypothetical protein
MPKTLLTLNNALTSISLPICPAIHHKILKNLQHRKAMRTNDNDHGWSKFGLLASSSINARLLREHSHIIRRTLLSKNITCTNATTGTTTNQQR